MLKILEFKSKITLTNILFFVLAIIHFILVCFAQYKMGELNILSFNKQQLITCISIKIITFFCLTIFYQLIPIVINGFKNNNSKIKQITKYFLIYFIPNLIVLILIYPGFHSGYSLEITDTVLRYEFNFRYSCITSFFQMIAYSCIPSLFGISFCNIFIFSIILSYTFYLLNKYYISVRNVSEESKTVYLCFIPFFLPHIIIINSLPFRVTYCIYIFILLFTLILVSYKTKICTKHTLFAFILAVLCAVITEIRTEYYIFLFLLPPMIYFLKIFDRKRFLIFLFSFLILFSFIISVDKINSDLFYELDNLSFVYLKIKDNPQDFKYKPTPDEKLGLKKVFGNIDKEGVGRAIDTSNIENSHNCIKILTKLAVKNAPDLFFFNAKAFQNYPYNLYRMYDYINWLEAPEPLTYKIRPSLNKKLKNKIIYMCIYSESFFVQTYLKLIGNPVFCYFILFLSLLTGLIRKNLFYVFFSVIFILSFSFLMLIVSWHDIFYVLPFYFCSYWILMIFILDIIELIRNKNRKV